jgi:hypothetical protein
MNDGDSALGTLERDPLAATTKLVTSAVDVAFNLEEERKKDYKRYRGLLVIILLWVALAAFLMVAFRINVPPSERLWEQPNYTGRYGYTWSLLILILPIAFLGRWYRRNRDTLQLKPLMGAVLRFSAWASLGWIILDVLLAKLFFTFPHEGARALFLVPGYKWEGDCATVWTIWNVPHCYVPRNLPFEELVFYAASALLLAFMYMWATEDFFKDTAIPRDKYETLAQASGPLINWNKTIIAWGIVLAIASIIIKKFGADWGLHNNPEGWPWYFFAQLVLVFAPLAALYNRVHIFTNPQAFLYVMQLQLLISLIWESTLAIPYGWWNYRPAAMMGITVTPWSNLQIEAIILWLAIGWSAMILYETGKIKVLSGKTWPQALLGWHTWFRR